MGSLVCGAVLLLFFLRRTVLQRHILGRGHTLGEKVPFMYVYKRHRQRDAVWFDSDWPGGTRWREVRESGLMNVLRYSGGVSMGGGVQHYVV